jgi:hypothetical protein
MTNDKKKTSQKPLISLWQYLLVVLIIILPAGGFYGGTIYQQQQDEVQTATQGNLIPDTLVVISPNDIMNDHPLWIKTITDKKKVAQLYNQLYSLPYMPKGNFNCPQILPTTYTLDFFDVNIQLLNVTFDPTGCRDIQMSNGKDRWAALPGGQTFLNNLQQTLRLSDDDFYGTSTR